MPAFRPAVDAGDRSTVKHRLMRCEAGHENLETARFCRECGVQLRLAAVPPPESAPKPRRAPVPAAPPSPPARFPPPPLPAPPEQPEPAAAGGEPTNASPAELLLSDSLPEATEDELAEADNRTKNLTQPLATTTPARTHRYRPWVAALGAIVLVLSSVGAASYLTRRGDDGRCEAGVQWRQRVTTRPERALIGLQPLPRVAIIIGGALVGFPSSTEFHAMGFSEFEEITKQEWDSIDLTPREGMLLRERDNPGNPGRYYYSAGGAVYQIREFSSLEPLNVDPARAVEIPHFGLDGTPRVPPEGTLLRRSGEQRTWLIKNGARKIIHDVCDDARIVVLPRDRQVLAQIPASTEP